MLPLILALLFQVSPSYSAQIRENPAGAVVAVELTNSFSVADCKNVFHTDGSQYRGSCETGRYELKKGEMWPSNFGSTKIDFHYRTTRTIDDIMFEAVITCAEAGIAFKANAVLSAGYQPSISANWETIAGMAYELFGRLEEAGGCKSVLYRPQAK